MYQKIKSRKFRRDILFLSVVLSFLFNVSVFAVNSVSDISVESAATYDIVTVSLSSSTQYKVFTLKTPARLVLELDNCEYPKTKKPIVLNTGFIKSIHGGQYREAPVKKARVVIDLKKEVNYSAETADNQILLELTQKPAAVTAKVKKKKPSAPAIVSAVSQSTAAAQKVSASTAAVKVAAKPAVKPQKAATPAKKPAAAKKKTAASPKKTVPVVKSTAAVQLAANVSTSTPTAAKPPKPAAAVSATPKKTVPKAKSTAAVKPAVKVSTSTPATVKTPKPASPAVVVSTSTKKTIPVVKSTAAVQSAAEVSTSTVTAEKPLKLPAKKKILPNIPSAKHQELVKQAREEENERVAKKSAVAVSSQAVPVQAAKPAAAKPVPAPPTVAETAARRQEATKDLVTLDFNDADIRDVFQVLAIKKGVNIIYGDDVMGTISIHLENVPYDEAMNIILRMKGLVAQDITSNVIRVVTPGALIKERTDAIQVSEVFRLNYSKSIDMSSKLMSILNAEGQKSTINDDERTNSVIVTSTPEGIIAARKYVAQLDVRPEQVSIEAKIVEISVGDSKDLGIEWSLAKGDASGASGGTTIGGSNANAVNYGATDDTKREPISGLVTGGTGVSALPQSTVGAFTFGYLKSDLLLTARLAAAQSKGNAKILSQPRISTLNNMEAKIVVGGQIPYTQTTMGSGGVSTQSTAFMTVGIQLTVTPTINADGRITMKIRPNVSNVTRITAIGPETTTKEAETTVLVKNGETIVIGGLITQDERKDASQIPLLGDIPILGTFFKSYHSENDKTELIIFVTPYIIKD